MTVDHIVETVKARAVRHVLDVNRSARLMFLLLMRPFRLLADIFRSTCTPRQIAFGAMLGMLAGIVPKDNLTSWLLILSLFVLRVNLPTALLFAFLFTWVGSWIDPLSHRVGHNVLTIGSLEQTFTWLFGQQVMPWTSLNNTVVMGSLLVGLVIAFPTYAIVNRLATKFVPRIREKLEGSSRIYKLIYGADAAAGWRVQ